MAVASLTARVYAGTVGRHSRLKPTKEAAVFKTDETSDRVERLASSAFRAIFVNSNGEEILIAGPSGELKTVNDARAYMREHDLSVAELQESVDIQRTWHPIRKLARPEPTSSESISAPH